MKIKTTPRHIAIYKDIRVGPAPTNILERRRALPLHIIYDMYAACKPNIASFDDFCDLLNIGPEHDLKYLLSLFERDGKRIQIRRKHTRNLKMYSEGGPCPDGYNNVKLPELELRKYQLAIAGGPCMGDDGLSYWASASRYSALRFIAGRALNSDWQVHHVRANSKLDNRPSNLVLAPPSEHDELERRKRAWVKHPKSKRLRRAYFSYVTRIRNKYFPIDYRRADAEYAKVVTPYVPNPA